LTATGCSFVPLTLTVGLGTFQPIRADDISQHKMHRENYYIPPASAAAINEAFDRKRRITAVGTTSVRALEAAAQKGFPLLGGADSADIFIYPPYSFWVVDRVITNFHRPDSTLLQLIAAIIGWNNVNLTYAAAVDHGFRFFSYGDSMAII